MIVTIDGPAGAGKSTAAKTLAKRLRFDFLDTGAMYRAVALATIQSGIEPDQTNLDEPSTSRAIEVARSVDIKFRGNRVLMDSRDVTEKIRDSNRTSTDA